MESDFDCKAGVRKCARVFPGLVITGPDPQNQEQTCLTPSAMSIIVAYCHHTHDLLTLSTLPTPRLLPASLPPSTGHVLYLVGTALYPPSTISCQIRPQATNKPSPQTTVTRLHPETRSITGAILEAHRSGTSWADSAGRKGGSHMSSQGLKEAVGETCRPEDKVLLQTVLGTTSSPSSGSTLCLFLNLMQK